MEKNRPVLSFQTNKSSWKKINDLSTLRYARLSSSKLRDEMRLNKISIRARRGVYPPASSPIRSQDGLFLDYRPLKIYIFSIDCGIAWNPFMKKYPNENKEWLFATSSTPRIIATKFCSVENRQVSVLHATSSKSQGALMEIGSALELAGADPRSIVLTINSPMLDACAAIVANVDQMFPALFVQPEKFINGINVFRDNININLQLSVVPSLNLNLNKFNKVEKHFIHLSNEHRAMQKENIYDSLSLKDKLLERLHHSIWSKNMLLYKNRIEKVVECQLSDLSNDYVLAKTDALNFLSKSNYNLIILTGAVGDELIDIANLIKMHYLSFKSDILIDIISEREVNRLKANIQSTINDILDKIMNQNILIIAAPNPKQSDREFIINILNSNLSNDVSIFPIIAWITKPSYWYNSYQVMNPESSIDFRINSLQFESPDEQINSIPCLRIM